MRHDPGTRYACRVPPSSGNRSAGSSPVGLRRSAGNSAPCSVTGCSATCVRDSAVGQLSQPGDGVPVPRCRGKPAPFLDHLGQAKQGEAARAPQVRFRGADPDAAIAAGPLLDLGCGAPVDASRQERDEESCRILRLGSQRVPCDDVRERSSATYLAMSRYSQRSHAGRSPGRPGPCRKPENPRCVWHPPGGLASDHGGAG